ncbi:MAG: GNAT family N-acetyltransferase [Flavobacteriales bacterium]|nr:GNAT family N-acetyltransferase [Flavobacteriales bacterium]
MSLAKTESRYIFKSPRLGFRTWLDTDIDVMARISSNPEVMRYFPNTQDHAHTERFVHEMNRHFDQYGYCYYAVDELTTGHFIGFIGMKWVELDFDSFTDIGWRLAPSFWGQGYATEGAIRCLDFGNKDLGLERIFAIAPKANTPSVAVMKKAGMKFLREFAHTLLEGHIELRNCVLYSKEA